MRKFEVTVCEVPEEECYGEIVDIDECCCENCPYDDEEDEYDPELEYLTDKAEELIEAGMCPECAFEFVVDLYETAYDNGFEDFRLGLVEDLMDDGSDED